MASTRSRMLPWRVAGSVPWLSISCLFQPAPTPNTKRPPESRSSEEISLASTIGSCSITRHTLVPTISFFVAAAANASATNGSCVRRYLSSSGPPSRATMPAETGMCVCSVRNSDS